MEYLILIVVAIILLVFIANKSKSKDKPKEDTVTIRNAIIQLRLNKSKYAGVVDSIVVRGKEYVNSHDHGRLFQTALQIDGYGECFNPTEAGSYSGSNSVLEGIQTNETSAATTVRAASWAAEPDGLNFCPKGKYPGITIPTDTAISKQISINDNVITWDVTINTPSAKERLNVEVLTGYLTADFTRAYSINPTTKALTEITKWTSLLSDMDGYPDGSTFQATDFNEKYPIIFSTQDHSHAIAAFRVNPVKKNEIAVYHLFKFNIDNGVGPTSNSCVKFSIISSGDVKVLSNVPTYQVKMIVGTLQEVQQKLKLL